LRRGARARAAFEALAARSRARHRGHRSGREPRRLRAVPVDARAAGAARAFDSRQPRRPEAGRRGAAERPVPRRRRSAARRLVDHLPVDLPHGRGRRRPRREAPARARGRARGPSRHTRARRDAPPCAAGRQRLARRRCAARRARVPRRARCEPSRARRALRARAPGERPHAERRALHHDAVDVLAVPAGQRVLRAGRSPAGDALARAASRRPHRDGGRMGRIALRLAALTALAVAAFAGPAAADPPAWRVSDGAGRELWLLGSVHYLRDEDYPLPPLVDALYARAGAIVMELDLDDLDPAEVQTAFLSAALLPEGTTLQQRLDPDVYERARAFAATLGFELRLLERFEPWFTAVT